MSVLVGLLSLVVIFAYQCKGVPAITLTPFTIVNLHEDTDRQTLLANVVCSDSSANPCQTCNIVRPNPVTVPFDCRSEPFNANNEFSVYFVPGGATFDLSFRDIAQHYYLYIKCVGADGTSAVRVLEVDIQPNKPPVVTNFANGFTAKVDVSVTQSNTGKHLPGSFIAEVIATDEESDSLDYIMTTEPPVDYFKIDPKNGKITTAKDLRTAVENVVNIKVYVKDKRNTIGPYTITVTINDLNKRPYFENLPMNITVFENATTFSLPLTRKDDQFFINSYANDATFSVNPNSEQYKFTFKPSINTLTLANPAQRLLDYETTRYYNISFVLNDGYLDSVNQYINLFVLNVNEPPVFSEPTYYCTLYESATFESSCDNIGISVSDPENDAILDISLTGGDNKGNFRYDVARRSFGFNGPYDVDNTNNPTSASLTISAIDSHHATGTATISVTILDVNDNTPKFIGGSNAFVVEQGQALSAFSPQISATDADLTPPNNLVTYTQVGGSPVLRQHLTILSTGYVIYTNTFDPSQHGTSYYALVEAKDGGTPPRSATGTVIVSYVTTTTTTTTTTTETPTTTQTTTTTTTLAPGYFDKPENVALFAIAMLALTAVVGGALYYLYKQCTKGNWCKQERTKARKVEPFDEYGSRRDSDTFDGE